MSVGKQLTGKQVNNCIAVIGDGWDIIRSWFIHICVHTCDMNHSYVWHGTFICVTWLIRIYIQPIADRVAQNLESVHRNFQVRTRRARILMGLTISTKLLHGANRQSHSLNSGTLTKLWKQFQDSVPRYLQLAVHSQWLYRDTKSMTVSPWLATGEMSFVYIRMSRVTHVTVLYPHKSVMSHI